MALMLLDPFFCNPFIPNYRWISRHWTYNWDPTREFNLLLYTSNSDSQPWEEHFGTIEIMPYEKTSKVGFCPEELKVRIEGNEIIVRGRHWQKDGIHAIPRFFVSHFRLPENVNKDSIRCDLDEKGRLQVYGQKLEKEGSLMWKLPFNIKNNLEDFEKEIGKDEL